MIFNNRFNFIKAMYTRRYMKLYKKLIFTAVVAVAASVYRLLAASFKE